MYKTEVEIFNQYAALDKTYSYLLDNADAIRGIKEKYDFKSLTFIGCGSSYSLCKSAEISAKIRMEMKVNSFAAGDLMLNFPHYKNLIKDTLLVVPSRSGSTSEVLLAVKQAKDELGVSCISICARRESELSKIADLSIEVPWAFDESVCQTRTVTNLYMTDLFLVGIMSGDMFLIEELKNAIDSGSGYMKKYTQIIKEISNSNSWEKAVVLADSELEGIAEVGALSFKEICQLQSNFYHLLDVRHGPMVLIDNKTLVIIACSPYKANYQKDLIRDLKERGALVLTISSKSGNDWGSDYNFTVPSYKNYGVTGIPFAFVPQALSYFKAVAKGIDPDMPQGLDPWIKL